MTAATAQTARELAKTDPIAAGLDGQQWLAAILDAVEEAGFSLVAKAERKYLDGMAPGSEFWRACKLPMDLASDFQASNPEKFLRQRERGLARFQ